MLIKFWLFLFPGQFSNMMLVAITLPKRDGDEYDSCTSSPEFGVYTSGNDALTFNLVGSYYFLCNYHCDSDNHKVVINIVS